MCIDVTSKTTEVSERLTPQQEYARYLNFRRQELLAIGINKNHVEYLIEHPDWLKYFDGFVEQLMKG